jgi:hypothetical protein
VAASAVGRPVEVHAYADRTVSRQDGGILRTGALDQIPVHHRQAAACQGSRDFQFEGTPINDSLVRDLAGGGFLAQQRNAVLVRGAGTGKIDLAIAIARSCIRVGGPRAVLQGRRSRRPAGIQRPAMAPWGRLADHLTRMEFVILDELAML